MPLIIGGDKIQSICMGDQKIKQAYVGDALVYSGAGGGSILPDGYVEVEYIGIGFNSSPYYRPHLKVPAVTDMKKTEVAFSLSADAETATTPVYGTAYSSSYYGVCRRDANIGLMNKSSSGLAVLGVCVPDKKHIVFVDGIQQKAYMDNGDSVSFTLEISYLNATDTVLFSKSTYFKVINSKIYSLKKWDANDVLLLELVPCINPEGVVGMYDIVGGTFHTNGNTNTNADPFIAGPPV